MIVYQALDTLKIGDVMYEIMASSTPMFRPQEDVGIRQTPFSGCSRGFVVDYELHEDHLYVEDLCVGMLDAKVVMTTAGELQAPVIGGQVADVSGGIASWLGLHRLHAYTGTLVVGVGDEADECGLGCYRFGSTEFEDCRELHFHEGRLMSNTVCELERMYTLQTPEDLLRSLVEECRSGEGLLCALTHGLVPRDIKERFARLPINPKAGNSDDTSLHIALAEFVQQRLDYTPGEHPFGLLLDELRRLRVGPGQDVSVLPWTLTHMRLHKTYGENLTLHLFEELLKPGQNWDIAQINVCTVRGRGGVCPEYCPVEMRLDRLRRSGSKVVVRNFLEHEFQGIVPTNCRCLHKE